MSGRRATTALAVVLLLVGAVGGVLVMMRSPRSAPAAAPLGAAELDANAPSGGEPLVYRADIVRRYTKGEDESSESSSVARSGDRTRLEWSEAGRRFVEIVRPDRGLAWTIDVEAGAYVERRLFDPALDADTAGKVTPDTVEAAVAGVGSSAVVTRRRTDSAPIDGHPCSVFVSKIVASSGGVTESTVWEANDLDGLAMRSESRGPDGAVATTELHDVRLDVDPALFELPAGCRRIEALP